ncbi:hypothetical protein IWX87_000533 [Polaromonas sp. CG_9.7]|nr:MULTISPECIES: hypothetical protein [unclassified Polaromonas]MBG6070789.1 hypothetical protein [Polaromonas sp. CG_9.7]MBG6112902.1 hypothetical protein [Polaromonas sp. CG_9.2]MDH6186375.1 hypothetical protein [Polaromonas sp. CG_23.6]
MANKVCAAMAQMGFSIRLTTQTTGQITPSSPVQDNGPSTEQTHQPA